MTDALKKAVNQNIPEYAEYGYYYTLIIIYVNSKTLSVTKRPVWSNHQIQSKFKIDFYKMHLWQRIDIILISKLVDGLVICSKSSYINNQIILS